MSQEETPVSKLASTNSFEIISTSPNTNDTSKQTQFGSYEVLPMNESDILDENGENISLPVPCNSPNTKNIEIEFGYKEKTEKILKEIENLKNNKNSKTRQIVRSLERHINKLNNAENNGILFEEFNENMKKAAQNDKTMNNILKNMYQ